MTTTCLPCNRGHHENCDGIARIIDQDGHSSYTCQCYHRRDILEAQRVKLAESRVERFIREVGLNATHELIRKRDGGGTDKREEQK